MSAATQAAQPAAAPAPAATQAAGPQSTSLYVGDLSQDVNEAALFDHFNRVGPVASIRVCRDAITRRSLGYAYVNFQSPTDAERALDTLNFEPILNRPCRIMWCQRDPTVRRSNVGNIFINGLDKSIDNKVLYDTFSVFGNILSCKVKVDENGVSTGRGFVHFETIEAAKSAIDQANGTLLNEKKIRVEAFKSKRDRVDDNASKEQHFTNVFIKNLTPEFTEEDLKKLFAPYGEVTSVYIKTDETGASKGFGFANFAEPAQAKAAVETTNEKEVNGKPVYVGRAQKKNERKALLARGYEQRRHELNERTKGVNLYVKNLNETIDDNKLREIFATFGNITSTKVMRDERNASRGFGFVCFSDPADATHAVSEMNGRLQDGKPLYVALAQPKEERRQALASQHRTRNMFRGGMPFMQPGMYPQQMMYPYGQRQFAAPFGGRFPPQMGGQRFNGAPQQFMQPPFARGGPQPPQQRGPRTGVNQGPRGGMAPRGPGRSGPPTNTRYNNNARNTNPAAPQQQLEQAAPLAVPPMQALASAVAAAEPDRQKQILGDHLYQIISGFYPQQAGKLTGMLLQMDNSDLLHLIEDTNALRTEVDKANEVLLQHSQTPAQ